jgi:hypothetical protein
MRHMHQDGSGAVAAPGAVQQAECVRGCAIRDMTEGAKVRAEAGTVIAVIASNLSPI